MNQRMKILKEIARIADSDDFHKQARKLGEVAAKAFDSRHRNQMMNLENIVNSTLKVTDVLDYIKKQIARAKKNQTWRKDNFGDRLKDEIEERLREARNEVCQILEGVGENSFEEQRIYLNFIREFVSQLVVHYEYQVTVGGERDGRSS